MIRRAKVLFRGIREDGRLHVIVPSYCSHTEISLDPTNIPKDVLEHAENGGKIDADLVTSRNRVILTNWKVFDG